MQVNTGYATPSAHSYERWSSGEVKPPVRMVMHMHPSFTIPRGGEGVKGAKPLHYKARVFSLSAVDVHPRVSTPVSRGAAAAPRDSAHYFISRLC